MLVSKNKFHRRYFPIGTTHYPGKAADLKDSFDIGIELPPSHPEFVAGLPLHGPNQWPNINKFREAAELYFASVKQFGCGLLRLFAKSLELEESFFTNYYQNLTVLMHLLHYPPQEQAQEPGSFGAYPHTDYEVTTIPAQDPSGRSELQKPDASWIAAPYVPGTFVINFGDLMARWTNGLYQSNKQQVVSRKGKERFSIPFFSTRIIVMPSNAYPIAINLITWVFIHLLSQANRLPTKLELTRVLRIKNNKNVQRCDAGIASCKFITLWEQKKYVC